MIGGFANGQVRFFDMKSGSKVLEVAVHARPITAMDVAPAAGLVCSTLASEVYPS